ncbi:MAG: hypothetical protein J6T94_08370 [Bacteroidaceae bacterium]|nr:hypothetical protein [Bacteroidaceae bacterium]
MKRKSFLLKAVAIAVVFNLQLSVFNVVLAQDVQVMLRPKMDPMPPQVMNYIDNPGTFFDVGLSNTSSELLNVFITIEIEKMSSDLKVTTPYYIQPNKAIALIPGRMTNVDQVTLLNQFRQLTTQDITLTGAEVSDFYDNGIVGLLPEGIYQAQVKVYKWDPSVRYPQLLSDPLQGKCTFNVCYSAQAPEIVFPSYNTGLQMFNREKVELEPEDNLSEEGVGLSLKKRGTVKGLKLLSSLTGSVSEDNDAKWQAAVVDPNSARFIWQAPILNCGGIARQYNYVLNIYPVGPTMSTPEEVVNMGTVAKAIQGIRTTSYTISPDQVRQLKNVSPTGYFVACVVAKPTVTNKANINYSTVENGGRSQYLVFRFSDIQSDNTEVVDDEEYEEDDTEVIADVIETEEEEDEDPGYTEPDEYEGKKFVYYPPKLTDPAPIQGNVIKKEEDIALHWDKPEMIKGPIDTLNFNYSVSVYKKLTGQSFDSVLVTKPIFTEKSLSGLSYTLRWDSISKNVKLNDNLVVAVLPVCTNENSVDYDNDDRRNLYRGSYVVLDGGKMSDCDPDGAKGITNQTLAIFNEKEIRNMEVMVGQFPLTITNANLNTTKTAYRGKGFITWKPMGDLPFMINVEFDSIMINSDKIVYFGDLLSAKEEAKELSEYIPYDMFDEWGLGGLIGTGNAEVYGDKLIGYLQDNATISKYCEYARDYAPFLEDAINGQVSVNLPVSLSKYVPTLPFDIQILSARFSPTNASIGIVGMFQIPETEYIDSEIAVFGVPRLCIDPESFIPDGCTMALLADFTLKDPGTQYEFSLKAPTSLVDMTDGCVLAFNANGFEKLHLEAEMSIPGIRKADAKGNLVRGQSPLINIEADIKDWEDWWGKITMDNFQVEEAPGYTFVPTGDGIIYDHSQTWNDTNFKFPEPITKGLGKDNQVKKYDKSWLGENPNDIKTEKKWQGLYMDKIGVMLPPLFKDKDNRIQISMEQFLWDDSGVSLVIKAGGTKNIVEASTGSLGGWGISLKEVGVSVVQNDFGAAYFAGAIEMPLIGGKWNYSTSFDKIDKGARGDNLRILFHMEPNENPKFDFFLAELELDKDYSHLDVEYYSDTEQTNVEFETAGDITIAGTEEVTKKLKVNIPGIHFTGMRLANFEKPKETNNTSEATKMKFAHTFDPICEGPDFWFELGTWGLASAEKTLGPFKFSLDNFGVDKDGSKVGVNIAGTIGLVGDVFSASAGVTVWANVDLKKKSMSYAETTLDELGLSTEFGGCKVAGSLKFVDETKNNVKIKGYKGTLSFTLPGNLIKMEAAGGFFKAKDTKHGDFMSAYFLAELGGATGIQMGVVQLNNIQGGFFFHTKLDMSSVEANESPSKWKTEVVYGTHGGMFGLGIATAGTDRGLNAKVRMVVLYDAEKNRLSTFRMTGDMHALCAPGATDGLINGKCSIVYQNLPSSEGGKYFQINITVDAGGDMNDLYKQFTGKDLEIPDVTAGLEEMGDKSTKKNKDAKDSKPKISCGVHISMDFKVTMKPDDYVGDKFKTKWHLYVGQPGDGSYESEMKNRCSITIIDFQVGGKNDPVAVWCKIWANAYICIGNELPVNPKTGIEGDLPPIPQEIDEFLNGKDANGNKQSLSATAESKRSNAVTQFSGNAKTGVMFGAQVGGEFGVNAVICYAEASLLAGFDVVLKQLENAQCNGKPAGGKGGFYGMGQVYAMAKGEMGLMINLWIFKGKWSLIDVGLGALLKGGFPNPSWIYGKVKAKCKLFGGLIKFNGSLTFEMGDVCFPDAGNPLDDVKIFEDMTPGEELEPGVSIPGAWKVSDDEVVSVYAPVGFTTNMKIGTRLDLVDENKANRMAGKDGDPDEYRTNAMRSYKFYLEPTGTFDVYDSQGQNLSRPSHSVSMSYRSGDQETFEYVVPGGLLEAKKYYRITQRGYCKEIRNGHEVDPVFNDEESNYKDVNRPWNDQIVHFFRTGAMPDHINQDVAFMLPQKTTGATTSVMYIDEMRKPEIHLKTDRTQTGDDFFNTTDYMFVASFEKEVDGVWFPADAKFRIDAYTPDGGKNFYYVDENGNIDYTTLVDENGNVLDNQFDPFTPRTKNYSTGNYTYNSNSFTYEGKTYALYGVNKERLQRFSNTLAALMDEASAVAGSSSKNEYYPLKWKPESFNSLETAIKYYIELINEDSSQAKRNLNSVLASLKSLQEELQSAMKNYYYPSPKDVDIDYYYQNAVSAQGDVARKMGEYKTALQSIHDDMERFINNGPVYSGTGSNATKLADSRDDLSIYNYKQLISTYEGKVSNAGTKLTSAFSAGATTAELNELKALYLSMDRPLKKAKNDYNSAVLIESKLKTAKTHEKYIRETLLPYVRSKGSSVETMSYYVDMVSAYNDKIQVLRADADSLYQAYYMAKQLGEIADAMADTTKQITKELINRENNEKIVSYVKGLETLLSSAKKYLSSTPEASVTYSFMNGNYLTKGKDYYDKARMITNSGTQYVRADSLYKALTDLAFSNVNVAVGYAEEQLTVADRKRICARVGANYGANASTFAKADDYLAVSYEDASATSDIAAEVRRSASKHMASSNQSAQAQKLRTLVETSQEYATNAMKDYNMGKNIVTVKRVDQQLAQAKLLVDDIIKNLKTEITSGSNTTRGEAYKIVSKDCNDLKDCYKTAKEMVKSHISLTTLESLNTLSSHLVNAGCNYLRYPDSMLKQASYLKSAAGWCANYASSTEANKKDETYANYMSQLAQSINELVLLVKFPVSPPATNSQKSQLKSYQDAVSTSAKKAQTEAAKKKGMRLVSSDADISKLFVTEADKKIFESEHPEVLDKNGNRVVYVPTKPGVIERVTSVKLKEDVKIDQKLQKEINKVVAKENIKNRKTENKKVTNPKVTNAVTNPKVTNAVTNPKVTNAVTNSKVTNSATNSKVTNAATNVKVTNSATNVKVTNAATNAKVTNAATNAKVTNATKAAAKATKGKGTRPGVAEAFELMEEPEAPERPEKPETPDGPSGSAMVSKVTSMLNASAPYRPAPPARPSVPAQSVISNASAMLNNAAPYAPTAPDVSSPPANPSVSGVSGNKSDGILNGAYKKTAGLNTTTTSGGKETLTNVSWSAESANRTRTHVDQKSLDNSKTSVINATFHKEGNFHYISLDNLDMYNVVTANPNERDKVKYRVVINKIDRAKYQAFQLQSRKDSTTTVETAQLDSSNKSYLSGTGSDGTSSSSDTYNLQAYMANYYKEMENQSLNKNVGVEQETKLVKPTIKGQDFVKEILNREFYCNGLLQYNFTDYASRSIGNDGRGTQSTWNQLDKQLEGIRPIEYAYNDTRNNPFNLVGYSDATLLNPYYYLYDPYVWTAFMGSYALFNGREIPKNSSYWDAPIGSPHALDISFDTKSAAFRNATSYTIGYSNRGCYVSVNYKDGQTVQYAATYNEDDESYHYEHEGGSHNKDNKVSSYVYNYMEASNFIRNCAVGYKTPSYNDCRREIINRSDYNGLCYTAVDAIYELLEGMYKMVDEMRYDYNLIYGKGKKKRMEYIKNWIQAESDYNGTSHYHSPRYQVGLIYRSKGRIEDDSPNYGKYFPNYNPSRFAYAPDQVALGIHDYPFDIGNYRFKFDWYCNNLKSITQEFYRCNRYDVVNRTYTVSSTNKSKYSYNKVWEYPLKQYVGKFSFNNSIQPTWND